MKLFKTLLITASLFSAGSVFAADSAQHASQASKHSTLAASHAAHSTAGVASAVVAVPLVVVGTSTAAVGSSMVGAGTSLAQSHQHQPLVITERVITVDPAPDQVIIIQNKKSQ